MADDILRLRSAFLLEHMNVDHPNLLSKSGDYSWKVHHHLLCRHSQATNLVKDSSTRGGNATRSFDMGSRDPWIVARLVQFLYTGTYDLHYIESCGTALDMEFSLANVLYSKKREAPRIFAEDKEKDENRSDLGTHLMMCELARIYGMPALINDSLHRAFHHIEGEKAATEEVLKVTATIMGIHTVCKSDELRKPFARFIADNRKYISEDMIRQWLRGDGTFAIEVMDCCLEQKNSVAEQKQITATEVIPNLKKRRPSVELSKFHLSNRGAESGN